MKRIKLCDVKADWDKSKITFIPKTFGIENRCRVVWECDKTGVTIESYSDPCWYSCDKVLYIGERGYNNCGIAVECSLKDFERIFKTVRLFNKAHKEEELGTICKWVDEVDEPKDLGHTVIDDEELARLKRIEEAYEAYKDIIAQRVKSASYMDAHANPLQRIAFALEQIANPQSKGDKPCASNEVQEKGTTDIDN